MSFCFRPATFCPRSQKGLIYGCVDLGNIKDLNLITLVPHVYRLHLVVVAVVLVVVTPLLQP